MDGNDPSQDVVLGRTLAETARLNSREAAAERAARAAVRRSQPDARGLTTGRRRFRLGMLLFFLLVLLTAIAAALFRSQ